MASPVIELHDVAVGFGSAPGTSARTLSEILFEKINVAISESESFVIIGPSGAGKSSLLKLMSGLLLPTRGQVLFEGRNRNSMRGSERDRSMARTGMLFQKNALFDSLTVFENVAFPLREVLHAKESEISAVVGRYLSAVGLEEAADRFPDEISGGMQKRLGIARALALEPKTVFYDDPTAGLDPITSRKIVQLIIDLRAKLHATIVTVTNDMNRAFQLADRIGMVVDGELIICGTPEETRRHLDPRVQQFIHGGLHGPLTDASSESLSESLTENLAGEPAGECLEVE